MSRFPLPYGADWKTWGRQVIAGLGSALDNLRWKTSEDVPAQNGSLLWDEVNNYPVVAVDGEWRPLAYGDNMENYDAFGRLRVSNPVTIFDSQQQYDKQPLLWYEKVAGSATGTHQTNESAVDMTVTTANGDSIIRQTKEYFRYQPGKSQQIFCTGVLGTEQSGTNKLIGYGDDENGTFFGQDGGGVYVLLRSNNTGTVSDARKIYQTDWNYDKMDGNGRSGHTVDWTKTQIFTIDLEWLGTGTVRLGLVIDGKMWTVHRFQNANEQTTTYMTTANLPVRYEITNTSAVAASSTLKSICCQVTSEGGVTNVQAYPLSTHQMGVTIPNGAANKTIVFATRHASTFNGVTNRGLFVPVGYEVLATGGTVYTEVIYDFTATGTPTWGAINGISFMEGAQDVGANFSGGYVIENGITGGTSKEKVGVTEPRGLASRLPFGLDIDGANPIMLGLAVHSNTNNVTADIAFHWEEIR